MPLRTVGALGTGDDAARLVGMVGARVGHHGVDEVEATISVDSRPAADERVASLRAAAEKCGRLRATGEPCGR